MPVFGAWKRFLVLFLEKIRGKIPKQRDNYFFAGCIRSYRWGPLAATATRLWPIFILDNNHTTIQHRPRPAGRTSPTYILIDLLDHIHYTLHTVILAGKHGDTDSVGVRASNWTALSPIIYTSLWTPWLCGMCLVLHLPYLENNFPSSVYRNLYVTIFTETLNPLCVSLLFIYLV